MEFLNVPALVRDNQLTSEIKDTDYITLGRYPKGVSGNGQYPIFGISGKDLKDTLSGGVKNVTYTDLLTLINNNQLTPGSFYKITDFRTRHTIPNTSDINEGSIEPIIVMAISQNNIHEQVISTLYKSDIIHYSLTNASFVADAAVDKGIIYYRKDCISNVATSYDFRNVKFRRWIDTNNAVVDLQNTYTYTSNNGNPYIDIYTFRNQPIPLPQYVSDVELISTRVDGSGKRILYPNVVFGGDGTTPAGVWRQIKIRNLVNTTFLNDGAYNVDINVSVNSINTPTRNIFYYNYITNMRINTGELSGTYFYQGNDAYLDVLNITGSILWLRFTNIIGSAIHDTKYQDPFNEQGPADINNCVITVYAMQNVLVNRPISNTRINGLEFKDNVINAAIDNCVFDAEGFNSCILKNAITPGATFQQNMITGKVITGVNFDAATHVFGDYTCNIFKNSAGTHRLSYTNGVDTVIYTAINA